MTTTIDRAEINRRNSLKSTGPRSPEWKQRSKFNAVKHGMSAATPVLPGEDPDAFRDRLDAWAGALDPGNVVEQFLVEQAAAASWKIERANRAEAARLAAAVRDAPDKSLRRREVAHILGERLLRGGEDDDSRRTETVHQALIPGAAAGPSPAGAVIGFDEPRLILGRLETTAEGCAWLLERWAELRALLERGPGWDERQFVRAIRLSGHQPMGLTAGQWDRYKWNRDIWGAMLPKMGRDDPRPEGRVRPGETVAQADRRDLGRQLVEELPEQEEAARAALLGVVQREIGRLTELAAASHARREAGAVEPAETVSLDASPEAERL